MKKLRSLFGLAAVTICSTGLAYAAQDDLDRRLDGKSKPIVSEKFNGQDDKQDRSDTSDRRRRDNSDDRRRRNDDRSDRDRRRYDRDDRRTPQRRDGYSDRDYRYGGGYGYGNTQSTTLYCRARGDRGGRRFCQAPRGASRIYFDRRRSDAPCRKGRDWGIDRRGVWVDNGCRADFRVVLYAGDNRYGYGGYDGYGRDDYRRDPIEYISCESKKGRYNTCRLPSGARDVRLARQRSDAPCRKGRDWGLARGGIWVDNGCRATFTVDYGRSGRRYSGW